MAVASSAAAAEVGTATATMAAMADNGNDVPPAPSSAVQYPTTLEAASPSPAPAPEAVHSPPPSSSPSPSSSSSSTPSSVPAATLEGETASGAVTTRSSPPSPSPTERAGGGAAPSPVTEGGHVGGAGPGGGAIGGGDDAAEMKAMTLGLAGAGSRSSSSADDEEGDDESDQQPPSDHPDGGRRPTIGSPTAALFVPSASPVSFGASAPVAAVLASSLGLTPLPSSSSSSSSASAGAALAALASGASSMLPAAAKRKKKANVQYKDHCDNCLTEQTPQWRKGRRGETFCQDCGRSERRHDYARLKQEREKAIERTLMDVLERSVFVPPWGAATEANNNAEGDTSFDAEEAATAAIMTMNDVKHEPKCHDNADRGEHEAVSGSGTETPRNEQQQQEEEEHVEDGNLMEEDKREEGDGARSTTEVKRPCREGDAPGTDEDGHHQARCTGKRRADDEDRRLVDNGAGEQNGVHDAHANDDGDGGREAEEDASGPKKRRRLQEKEAVAGEGDSATRETTSASSPGAGESQDPSAVSS